MAVLFDPTAGGRPHSTAARRGVLHWTWCRAWPGAAWASLGCVTERRMRGVPEPSAEEVAERRVRRPGSPNSPRSTRRVVGQNRRQPKRAPRSRPVVPIEKEGGPDLNWPSLLPACRVRGFRQAPVHIRITCTGRRLRGNQRLCKAHLRLLSAMW